jgi:hypothetical protein
MPDSPQQRPGSEPDRRRAMAYREEAEALREDLAQYLREGALGEEVRGVLAEIVRNELPAVLRETLRDESLRASLRRELSETLLDGLRAELLAQQKPPLDSVPERPSPALFAPPPAAAVAAPGYGVARARGRSAIPGGWYWVAAALAGALLVGGYFLWRHRLASPPPSDAPTAEATAAPGGAASPSERTDAAAAVDNAVAGSPSAATLKAVWLDVVRRRSPATDSPLGKLLRTRPADRAFDCWFGDGAAAKLGALIAEATAARLDEGLVRQRLAAAFSPCVGEYAPRPGAPSLVVFAAQAAASDLFSQPAESRPAACREATLPAGFSADGKGGPGTEVVLNALERCAGATSLPRLGAHSGPRGYLLVLYIGLSQLRPPAPHGAA